MKRSPYKVEKNIPVPRKCLPWSRFPFSYIKINESFFVPKEKEKMNSLTQLRNLIWRKAKEFNIDTSSNYKFSYHFDRENNGIRVFRVE